MSIVKLTEVSFSVSNIFKVLVVLRFATVYLLANLKNILTNDSGEISVDSYTIPIEFDFAVVNIEALYSSNARSYLSFFIKKGMSSKIGLNIKNQIIGTDVVYDGNKILKTRDFGGKITKVLVFKIY